MTQDRPEATPPRDATQAGTRRWSLFGVSLPDLRWVAFALVALIAAAAWFWRPAEYRVLFANVPDADGAAIVSALQQMNVPYRYSEGGAAILVPQAQVHDTRLKLAGQGLPKSSTVGFELLENQKFGTSQFVERVNYLRGLEGELAKSIASISQVKAARVHLVVPKPSPFARDQEKPRASVLMTLYPGRVMDPAQAAAITRLISTAVPGLQPQDVSLLDTEGGRLLSVSAHTADLDASQLRHAQEIEQSLSQRLGAMLEPLTGRDGYRVQVSVELNFDERERTEEIYARNPDAPHQSIRSEQWSDSLGSAAPRAGGVPGALSNQPQNPPEVPVVRELQREGTPSPTPPGERGARQLQAPGPVETGQGWGDSAAGKRERTVNYELDRTVERYKKGRGQIRRLTAAVLIDDKLIPGTGKRVAFTPEELEELKRLVRDAVGFDRDRGDTVTVTNLPFGSQLRALESEPVAETEAAAIPETVWMAAAALAALLLFIAVWALRRRLRKSAMAQSKTAAIDPTLEGQPGQQAQPAQDNPQGQNLLEEDAARAQQRQQWIAAGSEAETQADLQGNATAQADAAALMEDPEWQQQRQQTYSELMRYLKDYAAQQPDKLALYLRAWMAQSQAAEVGQETNAQKREGVSA